MIGSGDFYLWMLLLAALLFLPVRQLIWVLSVRRAESQDGREDEARRQYLKRRASVTAALLCFVFSFLYVSNTMRQP